MTPTPQPDEELNTILSNLALELDLIKNKAELNESIGKEKYLAWVGNEIRAAETKLLA